MPAHGDQIALVEGIIFSSLRSTVARYTYSKLRVMKQSSRKLDREMQRWSVSKDPNDDYFESNRWKVKDIKKDMAVQTTNRTSVNRESNKEEGSPKRYIISVWNNESGVRRATMTARDPTKVNADGTLVKQSSMMVATASSSGSPTARSPTARSPTARSSTARSASSSGPLQLNASSSQMSPTVIKATSASSPASKVPPLYLLKSPSARSPSIKSSLSSSSPERKQIRQDLKLVELHGRKKELESQLGLVEGALEIEKKKKDTLNS